MTTQITLYFDRIIHTRENNSFSQSILDANYDELNGQCRKVYDLLKSGLRLTVRSAMIDYNISSLPRRILDLKKKGVDIKTELIDKKFVEYYL